MKPIEFVTDAEQNSGGEKAAFIALNKKLVITDGQYSYEVLSYYYDDVAKRMTLDIQKKTENKKPHYSFYKGND